jgi:SAM-dependent methyltransferase
VPRKNASAYRPLDWDFRFLAENAAVRSKRFNMTAEAKSVRYPIRLLRYWFAYHLLCIESARRAAPIDLVEIGVQKAQFLQFVRSAPVQPNVGRWTVLDAVIHPEKFRKVGIKKEDVLEANLESPDFDLPRNYDAAVLLHVLEHLFEPDTALQKIGRRIRPGGVLIGGSPVLPDFLVAPHQKLERKTAQPMGHVSVFSPQRVIRMGEAAGCTVEFISGAFFMRSSGSLLENSAAWLRFNLWWGSRFPSWPGEIYWLMRKR